jgi:hypothetical protein
MNSGRNEADFNRTMAMTHAPGTGTEAPLSNEEIQAFAAEWYRKLDEHVPADEIVPMVAERDLEFHLPEKVLHSRDDFRRWYAGGGDLPSVVNNFFDEQHVLSRVDASWLGDRARVVVVVNWQAHRWSRRRPAASGSVSMPTRPGRWCGPPRPGSPSSSVTWLTN